MITRWFATGVAVALGTGSSAQTPRYSEGQVWAYHTRSGDEGSLLKIQHIEQMNGRPVYHITVIGVHLRGARSAGVLQHEPVSQTSLDQSVTELQRDPGTFPSADDGIAEWRRAHGGVFTITVAESIDFIDQTLASGKPPAS